MKVKIKAGPKKEEALRKSIPFPNLLSATPFGFMTSNTVGTNDDKITTSVKAVDKEDANMEAEKGEIIITPDLSGVYTIGGKTHAKGGTPLYAKGGSFIYSNNKDLAITKQDIEDFDFKKGGNKLKNNTPAMVLKREIDTKEYNRLMSIVVDPDQTKIAKVSAALMIEKYQAKMGQVAYLQEFKKNFPDGLPQFAAGSAPVKSPEIDEQEKINDTYAMGGTFDLGGAMRYARANMPPDKTGKWGGDNTSSKNPKTGKKSKTWNAMTKFSSPEAYAKAVGYTGNPQNIKAMQQWVMKTYPKEVQAIHEEYGMPKAKRPDDGYLGVRWDAIAERINTPEEPIPFTPRGLPRTPKYTPNVQPPTGGPSMGTPEGPANPSIPWEGIQVGMNPLEKLTIAAPGLEALTAKPYYDMLSQIHLPQVRLDRLDNKQELADIQGQTNMITKEAFSNSPAGMAAAISAEIRGKGLQGMAESNSRLNQQNTGIANQEAMTNYSAAAKEQEFNVGQVHQTFNNNQLTDQRMGEFRRQGFNASLNNANAIQTNLDSISQAATASAMPFITNAKDADGNEILVDGPDGRKYTVQGVPFDINNKRLPQFNPMFGGLDSVGVGRMAASTGTGMDTNGVFQKLIGAAESGDVDKMNAYSRTLAALLKNSPRGGGNTALDNLVQSMMGARR